MLSSRHIAILSLLLVAGGAGAWWVTQTPEADHARVTATTPARHIVPATEAQEPLKLAVEGRQPLDLKADTVSRTRDNAARTHEGEAPEQAEAQLKLALPDIPANAVEDVARAADVVTHQPPPPAFDLTPESAPIPEVESITLFNPEYGLNGFLKQRWISQRFGFQAGLGLNNDLQIKTDDGFREDIAVGMGVILTF